ncbi:MAG: CDF family Co(II)/Ni(II) efflux transporter DmeF [Beijerinckiaceae bacterium]|nr:CDF family Co(II)/Ni(II) efflux transporter DmeF [Beijerinckiaceae bacterium]
MAADLAHKHIYLGNHHNENQRRMLWVVGLTVITMVVEVVAGYVYNSMALLADGVHMATHAGALGLAAAAYAIARRHAEDPRFSFGTGKFGDLAGFASSLVLGIVALVIFVESVGRLFDPRSVAFTEAAIVAVVGLVINIISAYLLGRSHHHGHDHGHSSLHGAGGDREHNAETLSHDHVDHGRTHDNNLRVAFAHVVTDALTSVLAIAALVGGRFLGWAWLDPAVGILGAIVIAIWAWRLMGETAFVLVGGSNLTLRAKVQRVVEQSGPVRVTDLHVWPIGPGAHAVIVTVQGDVAHGSLRDQLASISEIAHLTIERR